MNKEEILKALKVIKNVCSEKKSDCEHCPFYLSNNGCQIMNKYPTFWKIQEDEDEKWRAFYD